MITSPQSFDFTLLAKAQKEDFELPKLQPYSLQRKEFPLPFSTGTNLCDTTVVIIIIIIFDAAVVLLLLLLRLGKES